MNFITRSTKVMSVLASIITTVSLITLIMLATLLPITYASKTLMCFIFTSILVMILLLWSGALQIKVFEDYKAKRAHLCADGIISICLSVLLIISSILFAILQAPGLIKGAVIVGTDIRAFLIAFLTILIIWKIFVTILAFREHRFNKILELISTILWFALNITLIVSLIKNINLYVISWLIVSFGWALIIITIIYMLASYVINTPKYLETDEAVEILKKERERREIIFNRSASKSSYTNQAIKEKLRELKELKDNNLISEEDYIDKKDELLNRF